jgi:hypothetical protein
MSATEVNSGTRDSPAEIKHCSTCHDAESAARQFNDRIMDSTMAIGCQLLRDLEQYGTAEDDQTRGAVRPWMRLYAGRYSGTPIRNNVPEALPRHREAERSKSYSRSGAGFCYPKIIDRSTSREKLVYPAWVSAPPGPGNRGIRWISKFGLHLRVGPPLWIVGYCAAELATKLIQAMLKLAFLFGNLFLQR